ncbi:hypothetical protein [Mycobacterium sp. URHB0044]|uniref:hypothetical protein n=1 Tax=Mycobacterium sp. URHB0044 TaxID=1380386 RepID=UPI000688BCAE|nr:hypothetical protein [Mycobacterium sp. URHB0044]
MEQLSVWLGAGVVAAGVSAALVTGAGVATADTDSPSGTGASTSTNSGADKPNSATDKKDSPTNDKYPAGAGSSSGNSTPSKDADEPDKTNPATDPADDSDASEADPDDVPTKSDGPTSVPDKTSTGSKHSTPATHAPQKPAASTPTNITETDDAAETKTPSAAPAPVAPATVNRSAAARDTAAAPMASTSLLRATAAVAPAPPPPSLFDVVGSVLASVVVNVGSALINTLQAVEAFVTGPPVLPPNSTVTVRSSTIRLGTGQRVAANWYYPEGDEPPTRMILLQHGLLALGPQYSYTAANLAERTNSIVVTPTLPSNFFAGDSAWLGGTGMASAIADLFVGDRAALTQSALAAGYATRYGLDPATARLPQQFALAGHSLGGNLVSAAAGFLAKNGAADDLVGVIALDGVPLQGTMVAALDKLAAYEAATGHYIPIREIGAPTNLFNSVSNINQALTAARPDRFNGVVLAGGVHMDSMRGGNPLIQFAAYLAAGFPQPQNPPAVEELAVAWLTDWFNGKTDVGDDLVPGSTIDIPTSQGMAHGVVIGTAPAAKSLREPITIEPSEPTTLPQANPNLAGLAA